MSGEPLYVSVSSVMSLWSEYRVFEDRLELDTALFGEIVVPFEHLGAYEVRPPVAVLDLVRRDHGLMFTHRSAKLDLADLAEHIAIERETGVFRQFRITPDDPQAFVNALAEAVAAWKG